MSEVDGYFLERQYRDRTTQRFLLFIVFVLLVIVIVIVLFGNIVSEESSLPCLASSSHGIIILIILILIVVIVVIIHRLISQRQFAPCRVLREQRHLSIQPICRGCCKRLGIGTGARCIWTRTRASPGTRARTFKQWGCTCTRCSALPSASATVPTGSLPITAAIPCSDNSSQPTFFYASTTTATTAATATTSTTANTTTIIILQS